MKKNKNRFTIKSFSLFKSLSYLNFSMPKNQENPTVLGQNAGIQFQFYFKIPGFKYMSGLDYIRHYF